MISNGDFSNGTTGWTVGSGWTLESGKMANYQDGVTNSLLSQTIGRPYPTTRPGYVDFNVDVRASGYNNIQANAYTASLIMQVNGVKYAALTNPSGNATATVQPIVEFSTDASATTPTWTPITYTNVAGWQLITITGGVLPISSTLSLRFTQPGTASSLRIDDVKVRENEGGNDLTSYSVNKGEELSFCLKSKKTGELHEINLLMYVALHEMAHIACPEIGHGELFKKIFKFLTEQAIEIGIYKYDDYETKPVEYCGMMLSSNIL